MEDYITVKDFSELDVKMTNQAYWNQFKIYEWVLEKVKEAAEDKRRFNCMENLLGPTIAYLKAKDVKRKERTLKNLYKEIAKNLRKATDKPVEYYLESSMQFCLKTCLWQFLRISASYSVIVSRCFKYQFVW